MAGNQDSQQKNSSYLIRNRREQSYYLTEVMQLRDEVLIDVASPRCITADAGTVVGSIGLGLKRDRIFDYI